MRYATHIPTAPPDGKPASATATDSLDRLLGLLERARTEQSARRPSGPADRAAAYRALLAALKPA